jgi:hypothetical protein
MRADAVMEIVRSLVNDPSYSDWTLINIAFQDICRITKWQWLKVEDEGLLAFKANKQDYLLDMSNIRSLLAIWVYGEDSDDVRWYQLEERRGWTFEEEVKKFVQPDGTLNNARPFFFKKTATNSTPLTKISVIPIPDQDLLGRVDSIKEVGELLPTTILPFNYNYGSALALMTAGYILESSEKENLMITGKSYIKRANKIFGVQMPADVSPFRQQDLTITPQPWIY